ncbi:BZ3500_MvSof-1268-A1-R1_C154g00801 [Microbotryum saponariae]|uniref:BZ3500_MvSof-1268-A1-R1_C154g00801 protein n=1 Tax=Microbotryum saponariae TaxID=289078 RepID=A0A2X0K573_9BASI|nr:BZ3500_MvSof-1268-A1-R1_C154g00801 [Microbotryum saponariae]
MPTPTPSSLPTGTTPPSFDCMDASAIVSDRDPKFTSQFWRALQAKVGTVLRMSTAAHPETDGSSENRIKMVTQTLRIMVSSNHEAWHLVLLKLSDLRFTFLDAGPPIPGLSRTSACGSVARIRQLRNLDVTDAIIGARLDQTHQANKHRRPDDPAFRTGSYVYLSTKNLAVPEGMKSKLFAALHWSFPYPSGHSSDVQLRLELPPAMSRVHSRFHCSTASPLSADNSAIPERIVRDRRNARGNRSFLVRWIGRKDIDDTWMSEQSLRFDHPSLLAPTWHNSIAQIAASSR